MHPEKTSTSMPPKSNSGSFETGKERTYEYSNVSNLNLFGAGAGALGKNYSLLIVALWTLFGLNTELTAQPSFQFTPINVPGGFSPAAFGLNNQGTIVGNYGFSADPVLAGGFILHDGVYTDVILPSDVAGGDPNPNDIEWLGQLNGINDVGTAVGIYTDSSDRTHSFMRSAKGEISLFPDAFGGPDSSTVIWSINNNGVAAGYAAPNQNSPPRACILQNGEYTFLDFPGALVTLSTGINDHRDVTGVYMDALGQLHGFLHKGDSSYISLDFPGATYTYAQGLNNLGQVVGGYGDSSGNQHGFLYCEGIYFSVDFPGQVGNELDAINDNGEVVGTYNYQNSAFFAKRVAAQK